MNLRFALACAVGKASTWALKNVLGRPAANFPGKAALVADPRLIAHLKPRIREGSVVVAGTNGKTTVTNMLASALEASGNAVACNRTGANLDSGAATALLQAEEADWAVLECDELWLSKVLPGLQPSYLVLLNLFRDQLDRMGEIEHIQQSMASALATSPGTVLLYNCDDPLCHAVADAVPNATVPFGMQDSLHLAQNDVSDAGLCQRCDHVLDYAWRQYGQLGAYRCPNCGFHRPTPAVSATDVKLSQAGVSLAVSTGQGELRVESHLVGAYSAYNVLATCAAALRCGADPAAIARAVGSFEPHNGRLQRYDIDGVSVLLNLAKNPTGFNQNLRIIEAEPGPKAVAFFVNDKEADGHDVSWLWDVDFQELAAQDNVVAFAGGMRQGDVQVRLKHAGLRAPLVEGAADFVARALEAQPGSKLFLVANYTALSEAKAELDAMRQAPAPPGHATAVNRAAMDAAVSAPCTSPVLASHGVEGALAGSTMPIPRRDATRAPDASVSKADCVANAGMHETSPHQAGGVRQPPEAPFPTQLKLTIAHVFPDLLNLYGDGGNVTILANRAKWRGIPVEVRRIEAGGALCLDGVDIVFLGGGPDRKQRLASRLLLEQAPALRDFVDGGGVLLAICGGYQLLGRTWIAGGETVPGLGVLDVETRRAPGGSHNRLVGNIVLESPLAKLPVVGYENHAGRTFAGPSREPFGQVVGRVGKGDNGRDGTDGALRGNVVATYLHGPLLAKNPEVADSLLQRALDRHAAEEGLPAFQLAPMDDSQERAVNAAMCVKLGIRL